MFTGARHRYPLSQVPRYKIDIPRAGVQEDAFAPSSRRRYVGRNSERPDGHSRIPSRCVCHSRGRCPDTSVRVAQNRTILAEKALARRILRGWPAERPGFMRVAKACYRLFAPVSGAYRRLPPVSGEPKRMTFEPRARPGHVLRRGDSDTARHHHTPEPERVRYSEPQAPDPHRYRPRGPARRTRPATARAQHACPRTDGTTCARRASVVPPSSLLRLRRRRARADRHELGVVAPAHEQRDHLLRIDV